SRSFARGSFSSNAMSTPIRRTRSAGCALVASGQATAPPSPAIKSRRLIRSPRHHGLFDFSSRGCIGLLGWLLRQHKPAKRRDRRIGGEHLASANIANAFDRFRSRTYRARRLHLSEI